MKIPVVDIANCTLCEGCIESCPDVFFLNEAGFIEVVDRETYPEDDVNEAIKYCPEGCIIWDEDSQTD
ncbi:MAG: ferredoxin [Desulfobacteraceae bacterium 4572_123]|nr:MAG: ferredoxin [Desulfobacteraceae bacterium 4572_123]